tara:strand:- start:16921 stop:18015 length:1095 start_codon:yes stop_codon:yes gene_type:complete
MTGGLLQLVAYGAQDVYLTGNPQITFFKVVYRRHTNFAMESIQQTFNGTVGAGKRVTAQISRNGDLIHKMYVVADVTTSGVTSRIGHYILKKVELEIGGQLIDRQYSEWMYIWNELCLPSGKTTGFTNMVSDAGAGTGSYKLYIPLEFWFCRNIGLALPLIALQYHEVKVNIEFAGLATGLASVDGAELWVDYVFLDTDERRRFAQLSHEYLIEQVQHTGVEAVTAATSNKIKLNFNHPVKELVWVFRTNAEAVPATWTDFKEMTTAKLQLNGNDRFAERDGKYFTHVQPYQHHENIPHGKNINVYSFALKPEEHQPSGTLNMSRIDTATLSSTPATGDEVLVYAVNYNVLRILSGMGGLAYSN